MSSLNGLHKPGSESGSGFVNLIDEAGQEIKTNKLVDFAIGALAIGTAVATRGKFANLIADFPKASDLLGGNAGASADSSQILRGWTSDADCEQEIAERTRQEAITKLAMLMTRNVEAAKAARQASEHSGALEPAQFNTAGKSIGPIIFENAKKGAKAFLDKTPGNHFTAYLSSLHDSEVARIIGD